MLLGVGVVVNCFSHVVVVLLGVGVVVNCRSQVVVVLLGVGVVVNCFSHVVVVLLGVGVVVNCLIHVVVVLLGVGVVVNCLIHVVVVLLGVGVVVNCLSYVVVVLLGVGVVDNCLSHVVVVFLGVGVVVNCLSHVVVVLLWVGVVVNYLSQVVAGLGAVICSQLAQSSCCWGGDCSLQSTIAVKVVALEWLFLCMWERTMQRMREHWQLLVSTVQLVKTLQEARFGQTVLLGILVLGGGAEVRSRLKRCGRDDFFMIYGFHPTGTDAAVIGCEFVRVVDEGKVP